VSRTERLLALMQLLRRHRQARPGAAIADELGISLRTLYRDIATLQAQGARIDGAPGLGYLLRPGFVLPPLMFSPDEIDALSLGTRWVAEHGDSRLAAAARDALAKIAAVLPAERRYDLETSALWLAPAAGAAAPAAQDVDEQTIRRAIRAETRLALRYRDARGRETARTVWPVAIGYFDRVRVLVAWCELRQALRHFRIDRIATLAAGDERYPRRRHELAALWRHEQRITAADRN
jgi:predicted DNA-binding transcriptional regulator YafY